MAQVEQMNDSNIDSEEATPNSHVRNAQDLLLSLVNEGMMYFLGNEDFEEGDEGR